MRLRFRDVLGWRGCTGICSNVAGYILIILQNLVALIPAYIFCAFLNAAVGKIHKGSWKVPQTPCEFFANKFGRNVNNPVMDIT